MDADDELRVIRAVIGGRTSAFRALVDRYQGPVYRYVHSLVKDRHDCEDLAQEVFLSAFAKLASFSPDRGAFSTWLFTIARNKCLNWSKRQRPIACPLCDEEAHGFTPAADAMEEEFFCDLDQALAGLPVEQRRAFVLAEIEGLTYEQICVIEKAKLGTIKSRISRAKKSLRTALENGVVTK